MNKIKSVKGMNDILPNESYIWLWLENKLTNWLSSYGYKNIRTPIIEDSSLFLRSIGEVTDIVEKELYIFTDRLNGDTLALRPEGTAGCTRSIIEHNLLYNSIQKLWYIGQMFRHERPQKGRYRQFHQLGVEVFGLMTHNIDVELILMVEDLFKQLCLQEIELQINCLGDINERNIYKQNLVEYFERYKSCLDEDSLKRLYKNPLRILDSKNEKMMDLISNAPKLINFLSDNSLSFYQRLKDTLSSLNIKFIENLYLVRGLDYYNLTVFEWVSTKLGAQSTIAAGGRYDLLIEHLGGKKNYAVGFAIGIERLILELSAQEKLPEEKNSDIFIINFGEKTDIQAFNFAIKLRQVGFKVEQNFSDLSLKSLLKKADSLGYKFVIIIGETELSTETVVLKNMKTTHQHIIKNSELINFITNNYNEEK